MNRPSDRTDTYTHGHHESVLRSHSWRTVENSAQYLLGRLTAGASLLDVGCGPGTLTVDLARRVAPGPVVGLDNSPTIVASARQAAEEQTGELVGTDDEGSNIDLTFVTGDVYHLDFPDDHFDVVHAHQVLQHLSDPVAALAEMKRVVAPNGVVAVRDADYQAMTWFPAMPELDEWMALYQAVARQNDAEPNAARHLMAWGRQAGFATLEPSASVWCFATPAERSWWGGLWADRILDSALADQTISYGLADRGHLQRMSDGWRRWMDHDDGWFTVLNGELLCS